MWGEFEWRLKIAFMLELQSHIFFFSVNGFYVSAAWCDDVEMLSTQHTDRATTINSIKVMSNCAQLIFNGRPTSLTQFSGSFASLLARPTVFSVGISMIVLVLMKSKFSSHFSSFFGSQPFPSENNNIILCEAREQAQFNKYPYSISYSFSAIALWELW